MIIDAFIFCKEVDLLEGRLEYLYNHVDYFMILEADTKYNGEPRELVYPKNLARYRKYQDKIIYIPYSLDTTTYNFNVNIDHYDGDISHWKAEARMREEGFGKMLKLLDNKVTVILSDVDEFPNRDLIKPIERHLTNKVPRIMLQQKTFYGNFDKVQVHPELATIVTTAKHLRENGVWKSRNSRGNTPVYPDAGWHLSCWYTASG
jgi:beta-1,4-mannosyl-glycoprotein beta-1,4-N-acetylglucosaminyltransferase